MDAVESMKAAYRERRDLAVECLNKMPGVRCIVPKGAIYVFPNITGTGLTSQEFSDLMLTKAQVSLLPGECFGPNGKGFVRIAFSFSTEDLQRALKAMHEVLEETVMGAHAK